MPIFLIHCQCISLQVNNYTPVNWTRTGQLYVRLSQVLSSSINGSIKYNVDWKWLRAEEWNDILNQISSVYTSPDSYTQRFVKFDKKYV